MDQTPKTKLEEIIREVECGSPSPAFVRGFSMALRMMCNSFGEAPEGAMLTPANLVEEIYVKLEDLNRIYEVARLEEEIETLFGIDPKDASPEQVEEARAGL